MSKSPLAKLAGPSALGAGVLIVIAQAMMLPFDPKDHVATTQEPLFRIGGVIYLLGFLLLMVLLVSVAQWLAGTGRLGLVAAVAAVIGTMMLGGDLWFETFAVPWLSDRVPAAFDTDPTVLLGIGALSSYASFALGWALFGVAGLRAQLFPMPIGLAIAISGLIGYQALLAPWAVPLGLSVGALGIWMLRTGTATRPGSDSSTTEALPTV